MVDERTGVANLSLLQFNRGGFSQNTVAFTGEIFKTTLYAFECFVRVMLLYLLGLFLFILAVVIAAG